MNTENNQAGAAPPAPGTEPETAPRPDPRAEPAADAARSPDEVMAAATARIAELEAEVGQMRDRWMRAEAEMANVRARARREAEEARQFAVQKFGRDVVEAAENLRRGLESIPPPGEGEPALVTKLREGFEGVERSFLALLERNGIVSVDPTGAAFDHNLHQAMSEQETPDHPPGTVVQAWSRAWTLNGRLLRPAMVVVSKAPAGAGPDAPPPAG